MIKREDILTEELVEILRQHAIDAYPQEAVGVLLPNGYRRLTNVSPEPHLKVALDPAEWDELATSGKIIALFHSHPNGLFAPTAEDMRFQERLAVPFLLCATNGEACTPIAIWGDQLETLPMVGRTFHHAITDCYELIRDWFRVEKNRLLPQFPRDWSWWAKGLDLYTDGFPKAHFHRVSSQECREGDVVLFAVRSKVPNHGGIIRPQGKLLHHVTSREAFDPTRLSGEEPIARWLNHNPIYLRHEDD